MRRARNRINQDDLGGQRSLPNMIGAVQNGPHRHAVNESGDFLGRNFNRQDLLPRDDYSFPIRSNLINVIWGVFKGCFITIVLINVIALGVDPSPLYRAVKYLQSQGNDADCDISCKIDLHSLELKSLQSKVRGLENEISLMIREFSNLTNWRYKLEYEFRRVQNMSQRETIRYIAQLEDKISDTLTVYDADKVGMMDYAMESAGGDIEATPDTVPYPYPPRPAYIIMGVIKVFTQSSPKAIIQPGTLPGQCFAFHGHTGRIHIKLARRIQITSVTMEHSHKILESDRSCCPKDFSVLGIKNLGLAQNWVENHEIGHYTYDINGSALQNFKVKSKVATFDAVELRILSNYGNEKFTCVYRFRVHGEPDN